MKTYITRKEAAARARMCDRTIDRAIASGDLKSYQIGSRVLSSDVDVDAWIERHAATEAKEAA